MSQIWYKTNGYRTRITPVEVDRHTDTSVWIRGRRNARMSQFYCFFPSWAEAKAYLLEQAELRLDSARRALAVAQSEHGNIKGMKDPTSAEAQNG